MLGTSLFVFYSITSGTFGVQVHNQTILTITRCYTLDVLEKKIRGVPKTIRCEVHQRDRFLGRNNSGPHVEDQNRFMHIPKVVFMFK